MKAKNINRHLVQYKELNSISDKDEFLHCFVYEVAIRVIKNYLIKEFSEFQIVNNELRLTKQGIERMMNLLKVSNKYDEIKKQIVRHKNLTANQKFLWLKIGIIKDEVAHKHGLDLMDMYIEYFFFNDEFKKLFYGLFCNSKVLNLKKELYDGTITSEAYFTASYIRTYTNLPKKKNDTFRDIQTHYTLRYKRPSLNNLIESNNKKAGITINADLPKEIIMQQVEKLVDIILSDKIHIYSNKDKTSQADNDSYEKNANNIFEQKKQYVDMLLIIDYLELREVEVEQENQQKYKIKSEKIEYIKQSGLEPTEKEEQIQALKKAYSKITKKKIRDELSYILDLSSETIKSYEKILKSLMKDKNYLKLLEGKDIHKLSLLI